MPNSEYLRLKALFESNPQYKVMLDTISKAEGTWSKDAYSTKFGGKKIDWKKGKDRSSDGTSNAHGKYQFMNDTWDRLAKKYGFTGFSPEEQDLAAIALLEEKNALKHIDNGEIDKAIFAAAPVWAALPKDASGKSAMAGQKAKPLSTVLGYTKSNESARAGVNNEYEKLNDQTGKSYIERSTGKTSESEFKKIREKIDSYWSEINNVQANKDLKEADKNAAKHAIKQKYYRAGYMTAINADINDTNKEYNSLIKDMSVLTNNGNEDLISKDGVLNTNAGIITQKEFEKLKDRAKKFNIDLGNPRYEVAGGDKNNTKATKYVGPNYIAKKLKEISSVYTPRQIEQGILKYGKTKDEYDAEVAKTTPEGQTMPDATTTETPEEIAKKEAEAKAKKDAEDKLIAEANAKANKPFESSDILNEFNTPAPYTDLQFQYKKGKQQFPFESLVGLGAGLVGAAAADSVEIKERDEQVAEGMLQYAEDIAKIKNMGLDPAIEGSLKMKLADAYQTGLENIVRASNGNRNLVLGNQGQLDQARMKGIVDIVAMDVDRSDKALAAFGEVQQYISEFEKNKSIANNERAYREGEKKQAAGMQLAGQGMSNFIDALQNAKENAPGSMNDMKRQWFQFHTSGILPDVKEGPGSLAYKKEIEERNKLFETKKRTYADFINSKNLEDQKLIHLILKNNPNLNPLTNKAEGEKATKFEDLEKMFNDLSGNAENKKAYLKNKGISSIEEERVEATKVVIPANEMEVKGNPVSNTVPTNEVVGTTTNTALPVTKQASVPGIVVTTDNLPPATIQNQLNKGAVGQPTGPETIFQTTNNNALSLEKEKEARELEELQR